MDVGGGDEGVRRCFGLCLSRKLYLTHRRVTPPGSCNLYDLGFQILALWLTDDVFIKDAR